MSSIAIPLHLGTQLVLAPLSPTGYVMMQLTAAMEGRWTILQIGSNSNSRTETDLFKSLSETFRLWLQQIKTIHDISKSKSDLSQSRNSSNEQNQDKNSRNQSHRHKTRTTSAQ